MRFNYMCKMLEENERGQQFSCVMAMIDPESEVGSQIMEIVDSIPEEHLYTEEEGYGRESEPHVTILYGLHSDDANEIEEGIGEIGPIVMRIESTSFFEKEDYNILKFDISSDDLVAANEKLKKMPYTSDFPEYHPHLTLAYLKKDVDTSLYEGITLSNVTNCRVDSMLVKISTPSGNKLMRAKNRTDIDEPLP